MKGDFSRLSFDASRRYTRVMMQQGRVQLDADWNERQEIDRYLERTSLRDTLGPAAIPAASRGFEIEATPDGTDLLIMPGALYVDGLLCQNFGVTTLATQTDLPVAAGGLTGLAWPPGTGRYLAYLDVWEQDVSVLQDASIRETALGGPDTATRTRLVWQVRLEPANGAAAEDFPPGWHPAAYASGPVGTMLAQTAAAGTAGACTLPPAARYTSLSNQLYRVEIHTGGQLGNASTDAPTFKWSRDNASLAAAVTLVAGQAVTVADLGPDDQLSFKPGQVVEILDGRMELTQQHGTLLLIDSIASNSNVLTIDPATPVPPLDPGPCLLRRWDQSTGAAAGIPLALTEIGLEAGITVQFGPGLYRPGDYWTFAARTAIDSQTGNIVWPAPPGTPLLPEGTEHHYIPLALVQVQSSPSLSFTVIEDCRALFAPGTGRMPPLRARWSKNGHLSDLRAGQSISLDAFSQGVMVATAASLDPTSLSPASVRLVADVPVTMSQVMPSAFADNRVVGTHEVTIAADLALSTAHRITITPRPAAQDLLAASLAGKLAGSTQADFTSRFSTSDFTATPGKWLVQADGTVMQAAAQAGMTTTPGSTAQPATPALALALTPQSSPVLHAGVSFRAGPTTGDSGMVFNWLSNADFWVFYNTFYWNVIGFSGAIPMMSFGLAHFVNGQVVVGVSTAGTMGMREDATGRVLSWSADLDITTSSNGLAYGAKITWSDGQTQSLTLPFNPQTTTTTIPGGPIVSFPPGGVLTQALPQAEIVPAAASASIGSTLAKETLLSADVARYRSTSIAAALATSAPLAASPVARLASMPTLAQSIITRPVITQPILAQPPIATPIFIPQPSTVTTTYPLPTTIAAGTRLGLMTRGKGDATFTRLQWTNADASVTLLPLGSSTPILVRMIVKRALLRTQAEGSVWAEGGPPPAPAPEPDFETWFTVTANPPPGSGYYGGHAPYSGSGALPGIGTEQL